jgi:hypothetical protein
VALDSIPRLAPEDAAEGVPTRTAAVTSHNCHSDKRNYRCGRQLFHIRDGAYRMPGHLERRKQPLLGLLCPMASQTIAISTGVPRRIFHSSQRCEILLERLPARESSLSPAPVQRGIR